MDDLAIKIFAALSGIPEENAGQVMYHYGIAPQYLELAEKLDPVFQEAYHDGIVRGAEVLADRIALAIRDEVDPHYGRKPSFEEVFAEVLGLVAPAR